MKQVFIMLKAGRTLDRTAEFLKVMVSPCTKQGMRDLDFLVTLSERNGWFFSKLDIQVMKFLEKCEEQLKGDGELATIPWKLVDARTLVSSEKAGLKIPIDVSSERNRRHLLEQIDPAYRFFRVLSIV